MSGSVSALCTYIHIHNDFMPVTKSPMQKRDVKERNDGLGMREAVTGNYEWTLNSTVFCTFQDSVHGATV
jgi:hypothetical protein